VYRPHKATGVIGVDTLALLPFIPIWLSVNDYRH